MEVKGFMNTLKSKALKFGETMSTNSSIDGTMARSFRGHESSATGAAEDVIKMGGIDKRNVIGKNLGYDKGRTTGKIMDDYLSGMTRSGEYDTSAAITRQGVIGGSVIGASGVAGAIHRKHKQEAIAGKPY